MRSVRLINSRFYLSIVFIGFLQVSVAQENSPFSRYGLGESLNSHHIISRSMGGLSAAYADGINNNVGQSINFGNPATYGSLYMASLDLGLTIDTRTLKSINPDGKFASANLFPSYLSIGLPLNRAKGLGMAFGLKPLSRINYSISNYSRIAGDSLQTLFEGSGGLNQFFVGIGKKWKNLSIGFNTGYNFGRKEISTKKSFLNDTALFYRSNTSTITNFGGAFLSGGLQYEFSLHKKNTVATKTLENYLLRFGLTGTLQQNLRGTQDVNRQTFVYTASGDVKIDSVYEQNNIKGTITLPSTFAAGVTFHKTITNTRGTFEMWSIGVEYTATQWSKYRFYNQTDKLSNSSIFKIGVQFSPDPLATGDYWSNVNYRAGFYTGKDYVNADGNGLKQYGFSFGAGLPIRKWNTYDNQFTVINVGMQLGKRGSAVNNITENFFQFSLGFSLSDLWFIKRKYD